MYVYLIRERGSSNAVDESTLYHPPTQRLSISYEYSGVHDLLTFDNDDAFQFESDAQDFLQQILERKRRPTKGEPIASVYV